MIIEVKSYLIASRFANRSMVAERCRWDRFFRQGNFSRLTVLLAIARLLCIGAGDDVFADVAGGELDSTG